MRVPSIGLHWAQNQPGDGRKRIVMMDDATQTRYRITGREPAFGHVVAVQPCPDKPGQMQVYVLEDETGMHLAFAAFEGEHDNPHALVWRVVREQLGVADPAPYGWSDGGTMVDLSVPDEPKVHWALLVTHGDGLTGGRWVPVDELTREFNELELPLVRDTLVNGAAALDSPTPDIREYYGVADEAERELHQQMVLGDSMMSTYDSAEGASTLEYVQSKWPRVEPLSHWLPQIADAGRQYWARYFGGN